MRIISLASGSSGNSTYIEENNTGILIDAGISCRRITKGLEESGVPAKEIKAILVTHEHSDHIKGINNFSKKYDVPVYATEKTWTGMKSQVMDVAEKNRNILDYRSIDIDDFKVETFPISHDALEPVGFCFHGKKESVGLATDTGYITDEIKKRLTGVDILLLEANHDIEMLKEGRYPWHLKRRILSNTGHLSNVDAGMGLTSMITGQTKKVALAHLSKENNLPGLAKQTVERILEEVNLKVDMEVLNRDSSTVLYEEMGG